MAVRIDASGDYLRRTTSLPSDTNFTITGWCYIVSHRTSEYRYFVGIENAASSSSAWKLMGWNGGDNDLSIACDPIETQRFANSPGAGVWWFFAISCNESNTLTGYWRPADGSATHVSPTLATSPQTEAVLHLGADSWDEWCDVRLANVKVWDAVLTQAEIEAEQFTYRPRRLENLHAWWPLLPGATERLRDYSGNGKDLTAGGTLTDEDGPPLAWGAPVWSVPFAEASNEVTGSAALTLGALTTTAAGTVDLTGSAATTLAALTSSAAGTVTGGAITGSAAVTLGTLTASGWGAPLTNVCINGVLTVNATNPRYFENNDGIIVLAGFHTWYLFQDAATSDPPPTPDFGAWLDYCDARGTNYFKIWHHETAQDWPDAANHYFSLHPWARTGPGTAADGKPRFDLDTWNEAYFERLRRYAIMAGNRGYYVCVQLFQGWQIDQKGMSDGDPWAYHPMQAGNNINSIDGDTDNDGIGDETRDESIPAIQAYQEAYVEKVLDLLNDLDHVIYEISNEDGTYSVTWQQNFVDHIHTYEAGLAKQHPVGLTKIWPSGSNTTLEDANEWLSYDADLADDVADGSYVSCYDTDHTVGLTSDHTWVWEAFCNGHGGIWYMDEYDGALYGADRRNSTYDVIRYNVARILTYANQINLEAATPQPSLASTGYCLANTTVYPRTYLVYQSGSGAFNVNVTAVDTRLRVEWLRISDGTVQAGTSVDGGATRSLTPPWADAVAFLEQESGGDASITIGALIAAGSGAVAITGGAAPTLGALTVSAAGTVTTPASAPTIIDHTTMFDAGGTVNHVIDAPDHIEGDVIYIAFAIDEASTTLTCSGFDAIYNNVDIVSASTFGLFRKVAGASEPATYTVVSGASERGVGIAISVRGDTGVDAQGSNQTGTTSPATVPAVTSTVNNTLRISVVATDGQSTPHGTASGHTKLAELDALSATSLSLHYKTLATAGEDAAQTVTLTTAEQWLGITFAIAPEADTSITGDLARTLGTLTAAAVGVTAITGSATPSMGALTGAGAGTIPITGSSTPTLGSLASSGAGSIPNQGSAALTLGSVTASAAGAVALAGSLGATLGTFAATGSGTLPITGASTPTLGSLTVSSAGIVAIIGNAAISLGSLASSAAGAVANNGSAALTLGALTGEAAGTVALTGSLSRTLGSLAASSAGTVAINGNSTPTLIALTADGVGAVALTGAAAPTVGGVSLAATATGEAGGILDQTLGALIADGAGTVALAGVLARTLGSLTATGAGAVAINGNSTPTLAALTTAASAALAVAGALARTMEALTGAGSGAITEGPTGEADVTLAPLTANTAGAVAVSGLASPALGSLVADGDGDVVLIGNAGPALDALTVVGVGAITLIGIADPSLGTLTAVGVGVIAVNGNGAGTLSALTVAGAGSVTGEGEPGGTLAVTMGSLVATGAGQALVQGAATPALSAMWTVATGISPRMGSAAIAVGNLDLTAVGTVVVLVTVVYGSVRGVRASGSVSGVRSTGNI